MIAPASARAGAMDDRDWWMPHAMLAAFAVLVAAILRILLGWTTPLHVWAALGGGTLALLALHAGWRGVRCAGGRRWREAGVAALLATGLAALGAGLLTAGHTHVARGAVFLDAPIADDGAAR